ncbi:zinc metallopeptidase [Alkaliphilus sp. B6464]|uniref:zinc metallopeptidase n=1 Tax=Alkaliphilus sp. B6464 TaxID=2731219 RepID=UPI001BA5AC3A|nr:zinc metallopeptidase [Alkaliphilus sp. B6464]QUH21871.1 zinc metallopeptidase [Alkaliphilus sp. B6464]
MSMIFVIVSICIMSIVTFTIINSYFNKIETNINLQDILQSLFLERNLDVKLLIKEKTRPYYDCGSKEMMISKGNTVKNIAEGFHELGHAIDDHNTKDQGLYSNLSYLIMKYSITMALILYYMQPMFVENKLLPCVVFAFCGISIFFFSVLLKEEIVATKYALKILSDTKILNGRLFRNTQTCLYNALTTYMVLLLISIIITVYQLIYVYGLFN